MPNNKTEYNLVYFLSGLSTTTLSAVTTSTETLAVTDPYVPSGSTDPTGIAGDISWSGNSFYWRDNSQWYVITGSTFP